MEGMYSVLKGLTPEKLDVVAQSVEATSPLNLLMTEAKPRQLADRLETDAEVLTRFREYVGSAGLDFQKLYTEIRPELSAAASRLFSSTAPGDKAAGSTVRKFINWIDDDQLTFLENTGDEGVAKAARAAKEYYKNTFAPVWREGRLSEFADLYSGTINRGIKEVEFKQGADNILKETLGGGERFYQEQLIDAVKRPESGVSAEVVADYLLNEGIRQLGPRVAAKGFRNVDVTDVIGAFETHAFALREASPAAAQKLQGFADNLKNAGGKVDSLVSAVEAAKTNVKATREQILEGELQNFLLKQGTDIIPVPNGYASFQKLFNNPQSGAALDLIMERVNKSGNPLIKRGIQAAYAKHFRDKVLGHTTEDTGARIVKVGDAAKIEESIQPVLEHGRKIFSDTPEVVEGLAGLLSAASGITKFKRAKAVASFSNTAFSIEAKDAVGKLIMATVGPLSRKGARIRTATTALIQYFENPNLTAQIADQLFANPEEFVRVAKRMQAGGPLREDAVRDFTDLLLRGAIYGEDQSGDAPRKPPQTEDKPSVITETAKAFGLSN